MRKLLELTPTACGQTWLSRKAPLQPLWVTCLLPLSSKSLGKLSASYGRQRAEW